MKMIPEEEPETPLTSEEIELKLNKIDEFEVKLANFYNELNIMKKRISKLQDQKEDRK